ncbi:hypothetical protein BSIN_4151 [Burkholderia singularis]|uniref:Uncharacterized protein n=1 Tax=Burkholderia singularis TaxID=1503053 RepID=A0A238H712_9BURK|nr:hypothetical protein BSIN_4151 [Burkholderia singularis]
MTLPRPAPHDNDAGVPAAFGAHRDGEFTALADASYFVSDRVPAQCRSAAIVPGAG